MSIGETFWSRVQKACRKLGISQTELSQRSGVSRSTLYQLAQGKTATPHAETAHRLASALGVSVESLFESNAIDEENEPPQSSTDQPTSQYDRLTNPQVDIIRQQEPSLFSHWSRQDWDEIYSCFGVGGALTPEGVKIEAARINEKRELLRKVEVILETHLRETTVQVIQSLYDSVVIHPRSPDEHK